MKAEKFESRGNETTLMPGDIEITFTNYKLLKEKVVDIPLEANVYIVSADNEKGKTSLITGVETLLQAFNYTPDPITDGQKNTRIEGSLPKADGNGMIKVVFEYENGNAKFVAYDGKKKINKVGEIRELLGTYVKMPIPELLSMLKTSEGRRKAIKTIIEPLLSPEQKADLEELQKELAENFDLRTDLQRDLDKDNTLLDSLSLEPVDLERLAHLDEYTKGLEELKHEKESREKALSRIDANATISLEKAKHELDIFEIEYSKHTATIASKTLLLEQKLQLEARLAEVNKQIEKIDELALYTGKLLKERNELTDKYQQALKTSEETEEKKKVAEKEIQTLSERITKGENLVRQLNLLVDRKERHQQQQEKVAKAEKLVAKATSKVEGLRESIKKLYAQAGLPKNFTIEDNSLYYMGREFHENQISESAMGIILAELLCNVNGAFLVNAGNYSIYGKDRFEELVSLAKKYNKHIFLESVAYGQNDVKVVGAIINQAGHIPHQS